MIIGQIVSTKQRKYMTNITFLRYKGKFLE